MKYGAKQAKMCLHRVYGGAREHVCVRALNFAWVAVVNSFVLYTVSDAVGIRCFKCTKKKKNNIRL